MKLTLEERETIILFNEQDAIARVEICNGRLKRRLAELKENRPDEVTFIREDEYSVVYDIPKSWIRINPTYTQSLTEEQRIERSKRAASNLHR